MRIPFDCSSVKVTSPFGKRVLNGTADNHAGYDLVGIGSHTVCAVEGGRVVRSRIVTDKNDPTWQWGNYICILTDGGRYHYYCHLASRNVNEGQTVKRLDKLGVMGNTGYSFGAHLHFEVREADGKTAVSPENILGIQNESGRYTLSRLDEDIMSLYKNGVVKTPEYWEKNASKMRFVPELLHNMAERLE